MAMKTLKEGMPVTRRTKKVKTMMAAGVQMRDVKNLHGVGEGSSECAIGWR